MGLFDVFKGMFGGGKKVARTNISERFRLLGQTGQGSMSKVYKAQDGNLGRTVALKVLDKAKTAAFEKRFSDQAAKVISDAKAAASKSGGSKAATKATAARAAALHRPTEGEICMSLRHDNIVQTFEHGLTTQDEPFLVMEWVEGLGLNYLIETKSKQLNGKRIDYLCQLANALGYLHDQRWLHRDLCPRNIMVSNEGVIKLIDFGLTIPYKPEFCAPGNRTGTADYLAPEIIKRMKTDHRVDIFALGVTAYEVFTGQMPWERATTSEETLKRHLNTPPRAAKDINPDVDDELSAILRKAIAREPGDRFGSAAAFRDALKSLDRQDY